jgi:hypothetical protein
MSEGVIPAFDFPGLMIPGQLGPMILVLLPFETLYAQKLAES